MSHAKLICTLLAASTLAFGGVAHAAPMIRLTSGASSLTLSSHSPSARAPEAAAGWTVGAWLVDMTSSRSAPRLDLLSGQFVSNAAGTYLDVELSDTDFSLAGAGALARGSSEASPARRPARQPGGCTSTTPTPSSAARR